MTIKYKLGFTIDSEVMFMLLSKFLPIQDLSVEEVVERPDPAIRFDKRFDLPELPRKPKQKGMNVDLTQGVNAVVMAVLIDGHKHSVQELKNAMAKTVYSPGGLGSRLERLRHFGFIHNPSKGCWVATLKGLGEAKSESVA